jgi:hypothetical protein
MVEHSGRGSDVVSFSEAAAKKKSYQYIEVFNLLASKWMRLTGNQIAVLVFINARTRKYGKESERIPVKHFTGGVMSCEGEVITPGLSMGTRTLYRAIQELEELGILKVDRGMHRSKCTVNVFAIDFKTLQEGPDMASKLCIPRPKKASCAKMADPMCQNGRGVVPKWPIEGTEDNKQIQDKKQKEHGGSFAPTPNNLEDSIEKATAGVRRRRRAKASSTRVTQASMKALWEELMLEHYPRVPFVPMSRVEYSIFKKQLDSMHLRNHNVQDILKWIIAEWDSIIARDMSWLSKYTQDSLSKPTLSIVSRYLRKFTEIYSGKVEQKDRSVLRVDTANVVPISNAQDKKTIERLTHELKSSETRANESSKHMAKMSRQLKAEQEKNKEPLVEMGGIAEYSEEVELGEWDE